MSILLTLAAPAIIADARDMRRRMAETFPGSNPWDLKHAPGGLVDIEFIAQTLQLVHASQKPSVLDTNTIGALRRLRESGILAAADAARLIASARLQHALTQVLRIALDETPKIEGATPGLKALLPNAFQLKTGATSNLTEGEGSVFTAVRVDSVIPAAVRPLADVRDQVIAGWQQEQRAERAAKKAEEIAASLKKGAEAAAQEVATQAGASFAMTAPFTRDAQSVQGLPADMVAKLFAAKPNEVVTGNTADAQVVARLKEVIPADPKAADADLAPVRAAVEQGMENDLVAEFTNALRDKYPVRIHRQRIDQFFASN